ncbi:MAG: PIN domain protein [Candidatus Competibacteraceae bacterium]|nr:PIN domain protein [Candidatus Competibacteraceae bacterium]
MRVYLDNCAFNRPFDDQLQIRIRLESDAKLYLQAKIKQHQIDLIWSYILDFENEQNPFEERQRAIAKWKVRAVTDIEETSSLVATADTLVQIGLSAKDALHVACAIEGQADYFVTTDDKLIKKLAPFRAMKAINPVDLVGLVDEN